MLFRLGEGGLLKSYFYLMCNFYVNLFYFIFICAFMSCC